MPVLLTDAPPRTVRRMARNKFLKLLRLMRYAREAHLQAVFVCPACHQPAKLSRGDGIIVLAGPSAINEKADRFSISCACTTWGIGQ